MQCDISNIDKIYVYCNELKNLGFKIFKPDINSSLEKFVVKYDLNNKPMGVKYALGAIKNIGESSIKKLVNDRKQNGIFTSLINLLKRLDNSILNKRQLESLIYSGALESIEENTNFLESNIKDILKLNVSFHENKNMLQKTLFESESFDFEKTKKNIKNWDAFKKLKKEHEALGFYLTNHPLEYYKEFINNQALNSIGFIKDELSLEKNTKSFFSTIAVVNDVTKRKSRNGKPYAFYNISDDQNEVDVICFEEVLNKINQEPIIGDVCELSLEVIKNQDQPRLVLSEINIIDIGKNLKNYNINLFLDTNELNYGNLSNLLKNNTGGNNIIKFTALSNNQKIVLDSKQKYFINLEFLNALKNVEGIKKIEKLN